MELNQIPIKILTTLYDALFEGKEIGRLYEIQKTEEWDEKEFIKIADRLEHDNLIKPYTLGGVY